MGLNAVHFNEVARQNMSATARITQALKVNDLGTAQRIAASIAMGSGQFQKQTLAQPPLRPKEHQLDVWA